MKLQKIQPHAAQYAIDLVWVGIDEKSDRIDKGWQAGDDFSSFLDRDMAGALGIKHEADRICARSNGGLCIFDRSDSADFGPGTCLHYSHSMVAGGLPEIS